MLSRLKAIVRAAHDEGHCAIFCDEQYNHHHDIKLGYFEKLGWHARLYAKGFISHVLECLKLGLKKHATALRTWLCALETGPLGKLGWKAKR